MLIRAGLPCQPVVKILTARWVAISYWPESTTQMTPSRTQKETTSFQMYAPGLLWDPKNTEIAKLGACGASRRRREAVFSSFFKNTELLYKFRINLSVPGFSKKMRKCSS